MKRLMVTAVALGLLITTAHADDVDTAKGIMIANLYDRDCEPVASLPNRWSPQPSRLRDDGCRALNTAHAPRPLRPMDQCQEPAASGVQPGDGAVLVL
jgi:hypothetical protein